MRNLFRRHNILTDVTKKELLDSVLQAQAGAAKMASDHRAMKENMSQIADDLRQLLGIRQ
ncbi:MAG: hypothetical protein ABJU19_10930 [Roseobacter sp.]